MKHLKNILNTKSRQTATNGVVVAKSKSSYTVKTSSGKHIKVVGSKDMKKLDRVVVSGSAIVGLADHQKSVKEVLI